MHFSSYFKTTCESQIIVTNCVYFLSSQDMITIDKLAINGKKKSVSKLFMVRQSERLALEWYREFIISWNFFCSSHRPHIWFEFRLSESGISLICAQVDTMINYSSKWVERFKAKTKYILIYLFNSDQMPVQIDEMIHTFDVNI